MIDGKPVDAKPETPLPKDRFSLVGVRFFPGALVTRDGLARLNDLPRLSMLALDKTSAGDYDLAALTDLPALNRLEIRRSALSDGAAPTIRRFKTLEHLHLPENPLGDDGVAQLASLERLKHLDLCQTEVTSKGRRRCAAAGRSPGKSRFSSRFLHADFLVRRGARLSSGHSLSYAHPPFLAGRRGLSCAMIRICLE